MRMPSFGIDELIVLGSGTDSRVSIVRMMKREPIGRFFPNAVESGPPMAGGRAFAS